MKHKYMQPADCNCGGQTNRCAVCDFGLAICKTCKTGECQIPTECPGRPMTEEEKELVCKGELDYDMGVWFHLGHPVIRDGKIHK